ncbi:MAG: hypothetical protein EPO31_14350 [Gammaproteobacteria bacterium]|nr:MAG: hypothetical protein EPO31_14350 [Gammaproteobacteria bacterium]
MEKEFGKLSRVQLQRLFAFVHKANLEKADVTDVALEKATNSEEFKNIPFFWAYFYELPFLPFTVLLLRCLEVDRIEEFGKELDPNEAAIAWLETEPESPLDFMALSMEEKGITLSLCMACLYNFESIRQYHFSINELIEKVREGNAEALFQAVSIDPVVLSCPTVAKHMAFATMRQDWDFYHQLSKAITKTRPRRPKEDLDDARMAALILDQAAGLNNLSYEQITDVLVDTLQVFSADGLDPFSAVKKFIQRRQKAVGT